MAQVPAAIDRKSPIGMAVGIIILYFAPFFLLGEDSNILIHDNLDANVSWVKLLLNHGSIFPHPSEVIGEVMNGIPASSVYPYYDFSLVLFLFFGIFWGYLANKVVMAILGFLGMYLLLRRYVLRRSQNNYLVVSMALFYGLLPFWSYMGSVSLLPLTAYALLNISYKRSGPIDWILIVFFAFYSSAVLSGVFVLLVGGLWVLVEVIGARRLNVPVVLALLLMSAAYAISHFPLLYSFVIETSDESHRMSFNRDPASTLSAIKTSILVFVKGQYHAHSLHFLLLLPITGVLLFKKIRSGLPPVYFTILGIIALSSIYAGFSDHAILMPFNEVVQEIIPIHLKRFYFLHPMGWMILAAVALERIDKWKPYGPAAVKVLIAAQFVVIFSFHDLIQNRDLPSFEEFYATKDFSIIRETLPPSDSYRVVSIGFHPAISYYNGFYTLDGYFPNYPLQHKKEFRKIIHDELAKDPVLQDYFDTWGSRCYAFSSEVGFDFLNNTLDQIGDLDYDFDQFVKMGGRYVLSSASINTEYHPELKYLMTQEGDFWTIYVYEVVRIPDRE